ncbi:MAG: patatin-like phospholipase family protein, partial [Holophagales bacterium]|nr:patatin-like phospholipase family protein [Holophagales bacterium]
MTAPSPDPESRRAEVVEKPRSHPRLAVALTGGGARGAYQVGVLRGLGKAFPELRFPIITGVSAGAVNATFLACRDAGLGQVSDRLAEIWSGIEVEHVIRSNLPWLAWNFARWVLRLGFGGGPRAKAVLDTAPLGRLLCG